MPAMTPCWRPGLYCPVTSIFHDWFSTDRYNTHMKKVKIPGYRGVAAFAMLLLFAMPVSAAEFHGGDTYTLPVGETVSDNVYAVGGSVTISGTIAGDLVAAGGNVLITGTVQGDVLAAGGSVDARGNIEGDIRVVGGDVSVSGNVSGEVIAAGGTVHILPDTTIATDVVLIGGTVTMAGNTTGRLIANGGLVEITGSVAEDVQVKADELRIRSSAVVSRDVVFSGPRDAQIEDGAQIAGTYTFTERQFPTKGDEAQLRSVLRGVLTGFAVVRLLGTLTLGLLLLWLLHRSVHAVVTEGGDHFWRSLLTGFLMLVSAPAIVLLLFISLLGIPAGILAMLLYAVLLLIAMPIAGILFGSMTLMFYQNRGKLELNWKVAVGGIALLSVLRLIPVIGWILGAVFYLAAFGSLGSMVYRVAKHQRRVHMHT